MDGSRLQTIVRVYRTLARTEIEQFLVSLSVIGAVGLQKERVASVAVECITN